MSTDVLPEPGSVLPHAPQSPVLTATELRQLAEWAHSIRTRDTCVVASRLHDGTLEVRSMPRADADGLGPEHLVIPVDTTDRVDNRKRIGEMLLTFGREGGDGPGAGRQDGTTPGEVRLFEKCMEKYNAVPDAAFWTESSVEKFLVPYYASVHSADDQLSAKIQRIVDVFDGKVTPDGRRVDPRDEVAVYAMVHLPKSEYVASPPDEARLCVLVAGADGTPTVELLSFGEPGEPGGRARADRA